jgi:hypothetical protein
MLADTPFSAVYDAANRMSGITLNPGDAGAEDIHTAV